jgi:hypothetical protein
MQLIFAGTSIANDPNTGGTDAIEGFLGKRRSAIQRVGYLRAPNLFPMSRFQRARTLTGTITPEAYPTLDAACQAMLLFLDTLPDFGVLQVVSGAKTTVYAQACIGAVDAVTRKGVMLKVTVNFEVGPGYDSTQAGIISQQGAQILNQDGTPIL